MKWWITHNEPHETCEQGYGWGTFAPGYNKHPGTETYLCAHNIIKSHAAAWHLYDKKYREQQQGAYHTYISPCLSKKPFFSISTIQWAFVRAV